MTSARQAREQVGLSVEQVSRRARVSPPYLRRVELHGHAPYCLAVRLARIYSCSMMVFLYGREEAEEVRTSASTNRRTSRQRNPIERSTT